MKIGMRTCRSVIIVSALLLGIVLLPGTAESDEVNVVIVKCASGQTIAKALEADKQRPLVVSVQGRCTENVTISRDDVTLQGDPTIGGIVTAADPTRSTIFINAAKRVVIDNLTVTGGLTGIDGISAAFTVQRCTIKDNEQDGIRLAGGSALITENEIRANKRNGVNVTESGTARIGLTGQSEAGPNMITENVGNGIVLNNGASGIMFGNTLKQNGGYGVMITRAIGHMIGGNIVEENRIGVFVGGHLRQGQADFPIGGRDVVRGNTASGIIGYANASLEIWDAAISDHPGPGISLGFQAYLRIRNSEIRRNGAGIDMARDSGLALAPPQVVVTENGFGVQCSGGDSSITGITGGVTGNTLGDISPDCTLF